MDMHMFSEFRPIYQHKESCSSDDLPLFEDAFDTDSLKKFFRQQSQSSLTISTNFPLLAKAKNNEFLLDEVSSPSIDERETQASPLTRYINRFSQDASPLSGPAFGVNLNYQFYADNETQGGLPEFPKGIFDTPSYTRPLPESVSQPALNLNEIKRVVEMRGQVNMKVSNGNVTLNKAAKTISRRESTAEELDTPTDTFEKLFKTKKIFKIQRNARPSPKVTPKQKACSPKIKPIPFTQPQAQSIQLMASRKTSNVDAPNPISVAPAYGGSPVQQGTAPVMSFLHHMHEKGYSPQQVMSEIQKLMYQSVATTEQLSPTKKH